jgi:hypothetical protein
MRAHFDFSKIKGEKNPYVEHLTQPVTIRLGKTSAGELPKHDFGRAK